MYKILSWTTVILWMSLIFYLSHQPATESNELSSEVTEIIVQTVEKIAPNAEINVSTFNHYVRKNAHFIAYFILAVLVMNALRRSGFYGYKLIFTSLAICVFYAISDEVHQTFVPGRSGEVRDVIIDSAGASVGIGVYMLISRVRERIKRNCKQKV